MSPESHRPNSEETFKSTVFSYIKRGIGDISTVKADAQNVDPGRRVALVNEALGPRVPVAEELRRFEEVHQTVLRPMGEENVYLPHGEGHYRTPEDYSEL
jgi:hypothetical protein